MSIHCWRRSRKFIITLRVSSDGIASISSRILSFKSSRDWGRRLKTFSFRWPGRLISLRGDVGCPARSLDISPCDYFIWGYLKEKVFKRRPQSLGDLKERFRQEIDAIPPELTRRVNFRERFQQYIDNTAAICLLWCFKLIKKKNILCSFQKYIQFFSS